MSWDDVGQIQGFEVEEDLEGRVLTLRSTSLYYPSGEPVRVYIVKGEVLSEADRGFYTVTDFADIFFNTGQSLEGESVMVKVRVGPKKEDIGRAVKKIASLAEKATKAVEKVRAPILS